MQRSNTGEARTVPLALVSARARRELVSMPAHGSFAPSVGLPRSANAGSQIAILPVSVARHVIAAENTAFSDLRLAGCIVATSETVHVSDLDESALRAAQAQVILLDARHARPSSVYRAVARLRSEGWTRGIVLILDKTDLSVVSASVSIGATDFVLSSAPGSELEARLRRQVTGNNRSRPQQANDDAVAGIRLHWRTHAVSFEGKKIALTLRELQLLDALIERGRELITSPDLARLAWGKSKGSGGLTATYVCSLRKKLAWFGGRFGIRTVRGVGYRFVV